MPLFLLSIWRIFNLETTCPTISPGRFNNRLLSTISTALFVTSSSSGVSMERGLHTPYTIMMIIDSGYTLITMTFPTISWHKTKLPWPHARYAYKMILVLFAIKLTHLFNSEGGRIQLNSILRLHCTHTCAYMHTFGGVCPKYTSEAVRVNYTLEAVGPLCALHRAHTRTYMYTHITHNQYFHQIWIFRC